MKRGSFWLMAAVLCIASCGPKKSKKKGPDDNKGNPLLLAAEVDAQAYWIDSHTLLMPPSDNDLELSFRLTAVSDDGRTENRPLALDGIFDSRHPHFENYPYLAGYHVLRSNLADDEILPLLRQGRFFVSTWRGEKRVAITHCQTFGVIDQMFASSEKLGATIDGEVVHFRLWAPTARQIYLLVFQEPGSTSAEVRVPMVYGDQGVWQYSGPMTWLGKYYQYQIEVYDQTAGMVVWNTVTDPYSVALNLGGLKSQIVDLDAPQLKPGGWDALAKPQLSGFRDISLYELHVRDFSQGDLTVPEQDRGKYGAFAVAGSNGRRHLEELAEAGITHIHLLPIFDFASVDEDVNNHLDPASGSAGDLEDLQMQVGEVKDKDSYNWGYDPVHYFAPEGSYSSNPNGPARILETRAMVAHLAQIGLRVVMDVVFNHTAEAGQGNFSVLDKIVPGYFYRRDSKGRMQNSTCCPDTASEHGMMEKLMVDALVFWAKAYKVDGFRFDLMGHHTTANLRRIRKALDELTLAEDGVDGRRIYLYGEGWSFGSLRDILPLQACDQITSSGLGIGTFNDRIRDRLRGGNFMRSNLANQGYATGLFYDYNGLSDLEFVPEDLTNQRRLLNEYTDVIKAGMAGNLKSFQFLSSAGNMIMGSDLDYNGNPAAYATEPWETINYVSAHDNYTLWDHIAAKAPFQTPGRQPETADLADRVKMQWLALAAIHLSQGIPFFHAGSELLRSKSGDDNSYNSGDPFNQLDFSGATHNFGKGLPPAWDNGEQFAFWLPRLRALDQLRPSQAAIGDTKSFFLAMARIRKSTPLLRLKTAAEIERRVRFHNPVAGPVPGLVLMEIQDQLIGAPDLDPKRKGLWVIMYPGRENLSVTVTAMKGKNLQRHPEFAVLEQNLLEIDGQWQEIGLDQGTGQLRLPPRLVVVYEEL